MFITQNTSKITEADKYFWRNENSERGGLANNPEWRNSGKALRSIKERSQLLKNELKELEKLEKDHLSKLVKLSGGRNIFAGGIILKKTVRKGHVDYKSIPELEDVDLEKYRKESTESWKVKILIEEI